MERNEVQEQIEEMNKLLDSAAGITSTSEEVKEEEVEDEKQTTDDTVEEGGTEETTPKDGEGVKEKEEEVKDTPEPELKEDPRDARIRELEAKLAEKDKPKEEVKKEPEPEEVDFTEGLDLDELSRDPKEFNKVLSKVYNKAVVETRKTLESDLQKNLPEIVRVNLDAMESLRRAGEQFYEDNPDLSKFKTVVSTVWSEVAPSHQGRTYGEILKEVAKESRKRLDLPEPSATNSKPESKKDTPPRLPGRTGKGGRAPESTKPDPLQAELDEMNKSLGR